jgi:hypothetical protein
MNLPFESVRGRGSDPIPAWLGSPRPAALRAPAGRAGARVTGNTMLFRLLGALLAVVVVQS